MRRGKGEKMNMIKYITGDLFKLLPYDEPQNKFIPHICNDIGLWGKGFVVPLARKWPQTKKDYLQWYKEDVLSELGDIQPIKTEKNIYVMNMIAQHETILTHPKPIRYAALVKCMEKVVMCGKPDATEIHAPMFGSALSGGNWTFIEELIEEIWVNNGIPVTVYQL